ncbi:LicD family protein [Pseudobutyrivibrio ruminis]|uniref:LicD family protein n=1 Tax=Pseudobutyrivibrio ruminis TaxID=46206 RepID=UPI0009DF5491|nr:LicD family protein [Pseudobutyrivibrio ruminis]
MSQLFNIFEDSDNRNIVLFGTGRYASYYMEVYGKYRKPIFMVDNNSGKWGNSYFGCEIKNPNVLSKINVDRVRIIIAVKDYEVILQQLKEIGIAEEFIRVLRVDQPVQKLYEMGYAMAIVDDKGDEQLEYIRNFARVCKRFVLGIPDDLIMGRLYTEARGYNSNILTDSLLSRDWIDDVVTLDYSHLRYPEMHKELQFDACLYGSAYGKEFESDKKYFMEQGVEFISAVPEGRLGKMPGDPLELGIDNIHTTTKKIVIFGTGLYAQKFMQEYPDCPVAYAIDSNPDLWGNTFGDLIVHSPVKLREEVVDNTVVIICAKDYDSIISTIHEYGDFHYLTMVYRQEIALLENFGVVEQDEQDYIVKAHNILYKLVEEFKSVCDEYGLHYYIICGSLIGVLRHQDMVPWDDDIDIAMPREDYNKLKKIAKERWDNDTFKFLDYKDYGGGAFLDCMPRLFYLKSKLPTKVFKKVQGKATADVADRMFLDIYVMDNAHPNPKVHAFCMGCMKGIYNLCMGHRGVKDYSEYEGYVSKDVLMLMKTLHAIGSILPLPFLIWMYECFSQSANWNKKCDSYFMNACAIVCIERTFKKEFFEEGGHGMLHGIDVKIPKDPDGLFTAMHYGGLASIMNYPPYSIRKPSHYFNCDIEIWR